MAVEKSRQGGATFRFQGVAFLFVLGGSVWALDCWLYFAVQLALRGRYLHSNYLQFAPTAPRALYTPFCKGGIDARLFWGYRQTRAKRILSYPKQIDGARHRYGCRAPSFLAFTSNKQPLIGLHLKVCNLNILFLVHSFQGHCITYAFFYNRFQCHCEVFSR